MASQESPEREAWADIMDTMVLGLARTMGGMAGEDKTVVLDRPVPTETPEDITATR